MINVPCPSCPPTIAVGANQTRRLDFNDCCGTSHGSSDQDGADGGAMSWSWSCSAGLSHLAMNINDAPTCCPTRTLFEMTVNPGAII